MSYSYRSSKSSSVGSRYGRTNTGQQKNRRHQGQYIDPARFVRAAKPVTADAYQPVNQFADFAIAPLLKANLAGKGFTTPTPIQDQTIPPALAGKDVIGLANTGTGKTAAFAIPVIDALMKDANARALIIAPTRELAQQIEDDLRSIAKGSGLDGVLLIGGAPIGPQLRDLRNRPRVIIGTPGRIKDHLERGTLQLHTTKFVVLDEVDRMLDMGFVDDVRSILSELSPTRQSFFFSATLDDRVSTLIRTFANDPVMISAKSGETSDNVHQDVVLYGGTGERLDILHDILLKQDVDKVIIFDETQRSVERLSQALQLRGHQAESIHGGKNQNQRQRALDRFKKNEITVLVATDVAARGIDVADITHVINFSTPKSYQDYVHRIGRAGRAGRTGTALTFVSR